MSAIIGIPLGAVIFYLCAGFVSWYSSSDRQPVRFWAWWREWK